MTAERVSEVTLIEAQKEAERNLPEAQKIESVGEALTHANIDIVGGETTSWRKSSARSVTERPWIAGWPTVRRSTTFFNGDPEQLSAWARFLGRTPPPQTPRP